MSDQVDIAKMRLVETVNAYDNFDITKYNNSEYVARYIESVVDDLIDRLVVPQRFEVVELQHTIDKLKNQIK